jgi:hypothetical protein
MIIAGCADDGSLSPGGMTTSSVDQATQTAKADPACATLAAQIETLHKDGVADKVAKAAAKKYTMKSADLAKADELNKANAEFTSRCSAVTPPNVAEAPPAPAQPAAKVATKAATPPVPAPKKPVTAALSPKEVAVQAPAAQPAPSPEPAATPQP